MSAANQGGAVVGWGLGGLVLGAANYPGLAIMTLLGGTIAASLALPLARRTTPR